MAWFKRNRHEAPASGGHDLDAVAPEPAPDAEPAADSPPASAPAAPAWTTAAPMPLATPTIQRVLSGDARSSTTLGRPSPLSLAPLGHAVTAEAPAGVVGALAVVEHGDELRHAGDPGGGDEPPLEYVQRAPADAPSGRPAAPAQLLVPAFQPPEPTRLPTVPVAAPEVQRAPATPSFTTAPNPGPPLVLVAGEVLSPPPVSRAPETSGPAGPVPAAAPLLADLLAAEGESAGPAAVPGAHEVQRAPDSELPLAPVQRHADHPGHVDGDEAPDATDVQRAPTSGPPAAAPPSPVAPTLAETSLTTTSPLDPTPAATIPGAEPAPDSELPLAAVQRHADHPGHVGGGEAPTAADVQRAPASAPPAPSPPAPSIPVAPTLAETPHITASPLDSTPAAPGPGAEPAPDIDLPLAPLQRHADHPGHVDGDEAPTSADVQRAPAAAPPAPTIPVAPTLAETPLTTAPPLDPTPAAPIPGAEPAPDTDLPLAPVQRHTDHPGQVDDDEAPDAPPTPGAAEVQRAPIDAPPAAGTVSSAPLVGSAPPLTTPEGLTGPTTVPEALPATPPSDLPLSGAAVQRAAAPRRPVGLGRPIAAVPPGVVEPGTVQRAPVQPAAAPSATPSVGAGSTAATAEPAPLDLAQSAPAPPTAPLVGETPLVTTPTTPAGSSADHAAEAAGPMATPGPDLDLVQRSPSSPGGPSAPTSPATIPSSASSATTPVATTVPPLVVAPLLGGRPFSTHIQRSVDDIAGREAAHSGPVDRTSPDALSPEPGRLYQPLAEIGVWNGAPPPGLSGPAIEAPPSHVAAAVQRATGTDVSNVRIRRDTGPTAQRLAAGAFTHAGEVHIPAAVGSLDSGEGASLATHELVHAGQQSILGSSRPHEHTPQGQHLEAQARSAEHASLAGLELPHLPLAPPAAPTVQRAPVETSSSPFSPQQLDTLIRLADNPPEGGTTVQRVETTVAPPRPSSSAPPLPATAGTDGASAGPRTPQEIEELATKLFPTMRNLFRSELLGFRRRTGTTSDRPLS